MCPTLYSMSNCEVGGDILYVQPHVRIQFAICGCLCVPREYFCSVNVIEMCSNMTCSRTMCTCT